MSPHRRWVHGSIIGLCLGLCALTQLGPARSAARPARVPSRPLQFPGQTAPVFHPEWALGDATYLCRVCGPRPGGSPAEARAASHVAARLRQLGYTVAVQTDVALPPPRTASRNVSAWWPTAVGRPRLLLVAHLDTRGGPGANDNASGVAVTLELARALAGRAGPYALEVLFCGAEEYQPGGGHHFGSRQYAATATGRGPLAGVVSVDMVGRGSELHLWTAGGSAAYLSGLFARSAVALGQPLQRAPGPHASDHASFAARGTPAVWLQALPDPANHTPGDDPARLDPATLARAGKLLLHVLTHLEAEDVRLLQGGRRG